MFPLRSYDEERGMMLYCVVSMASTSLHFFSRFYDSGIRFFGRHKTYTALLFVIATGIVFYALFSTPKVTNETLLVTLSTIEQSVKVSGQVQASKDANLSFQAGGQVAFIGVKTGDTVAQGKVLATLLGGDAQASLLQAEATLANAKAVLEQLQQGAREEEIAIKEQAVTNAKSTLDQAYASIPDAIQNVDAVTADVIKNKFSSLFILNNAQYLLSFSSCDQRLQTQIETKRTELQNVLADFQTKSSVITSISQTKNIDTTFESAYQAAIATNDLVNTISNLLLLHVVLLTLASIVIAHHLLFQKQV